MVLFNHATREMTAKIVYYGPGLCGKTTNLLVIFDKLDSKSRGKMLSLATKTDRTLFFDLLPVDIGRVGAFNLRIQLYTVPGQVFYNETRKLVLKGADSVVFVADSQPSMVDSNRESFANLLENLAENQIDVDDTPIIIQYNKRDLPGVMDVDDLQTQLSFSGLPFVEASALRGDGVMETFKVASKLTAKHLLGRVKGKAPKLRDFTMKSWPAVAGAPAPAARKKTAEKAPPAIEIEETPFPVEAEEVEEISTPFPESPIAEQVEAPFESAVGTDYDQVQEVSLEDLLVGRERPLTLSGNVPIPVEIAEEEPEEVEALDEAQVVEIDASPVAASGNGELQSEVDRLRDENQLLRDAIRRISGELSDLASR